MDNTTLMILLFIGVVLVSQKTSAKAPISRKNGLTFDYTNLNWETISPEYKTCKDGWQQSPINIVAASIIPTPGSRLPTNYNITKATLINADKFVEMSVEGISEVINSKRYRLLSIRWHTPSEHLINDVQYDAEMQQMFTSEDGSIAIVATLYKISPLVDHYDSLISALALSMKQLVEPTTFKEVEVEADLEVVNQDLSNYFEDCHYYRYDGSLTTPPCTEKVTWIIATKVQSISSGQIKLLQYAVTSPNKKNARPIQPVYDRKVQDVGKLI